MGARCSSGCRGEDPGRQGHAPEPPARDTGPASRASPCPGVEDFALRGDTYATLLVDLEARQPLDVLAGRDAEPLAAWLRGHPEVEIICRDRADAYAEGARSGAPQAQQVADGWHLWRNLSEAVEKTFGAHHPCIRAEFATPPGADTEAVPDRHKPDTTRPGRLLGKTAGRRARRRTSDRALRITRAYASAPDSTEPRSHPISPLSLFLDRTQM